MYRYLHFVRPFIFLLSSRLCFLIVSLTLIVCHGVAYGAPSHHIQIDPSTKSVGKAIVPIAGPLGFLCDVMDQYHRAIDVYTEDSAAGNHFVAQARLASSPNEPDAISTALPPMQFDCTEQPYSGFTCIKAIFHCNARKSPHWAGWYFQNGTLTGPERVPQPNWGTVGKAGYNLTGVVRLAFWARGKLGGEKIAFFCGGVGYDDQGHAIKKDEFDRKIVRPDSFPKRSVTTSLDANGEREVWKETVTLTQDWKKYYIDVQGADLSYVLGGFGWTASSVGQPDKIVTFYLDDLRFELAPEAQAARLNLPRFLVSYPRPQANEVFDRILKNTAFAYDNSLALMACLAAGDDRRAKLIADAFVYAVDHDRQFSDGRLRTAFQGGDLILPPGWNPFDKDDRYRTPGWMDLVAGETDRKWLEDSYFLGMNTGNMAWVCLSLLAYHEKHYPHRFATSSYLNAALAMAEFMKTQLRVKGDGKDGFANYIAGLETGPENGQVSPPPPGVEHNNKLTYRATEHAIDLYAVFRRLAYLTAPSGQNINAVWQAEATLMRRFVESMWDDGNQGGVPRIHPYQKAPCKFWTGTDIQGHKINAEVVPVDIQTWIHLSLRGAAKPYRTSFQYAEKFHKVNQGYDFAKSAEKDTKKAWGVWPEGTAQMAAGYTYLGQTNKNGQPILKAKQILTFLKSRLKNNAMPAALPIDGTDTLFTGFNLSNGQPWNYYRRPHIGATAWYILAALKANPYWLFSRVPEEMPRAIGGKAK